LSDAKPARRGRFRASLTTVDSHLPPSPRLFEVSWQASGR
jgi:hypothetical protein